MAECLKKDAPKIDIDSFERRVIRPVIEQLAKRMQESMSDFWAGWEAAADYHDLGKDPEFDAIKRSYFRYMDGKPNGAP